MLKKNPIVLFMLVLSLLYQLYVVLVGRIIQKTQTLMGFRGNIEHIVLLVSLLLFIGMIIWQGKDGSPGEKIELSGTWLRSFISLFSFIVIGIIYINPHARFPWKYYPYAYSTIHSEKLKLYEKLDKSPQIVVMGSSRAFTMPADYIEEISGYRTFNMSVTSATPLDLFALEQYVIDHNQEKPPLLVVEILGRGLVNTSNKQDNMPLELLPYLPIIDTGPIIGATFDDVISLPSFSDALYILLGFDVESRVVENILPDGTVVFKNREISHNLKQQSAVIYSANYSCVTVRDGLNEDGEIYIERMIRLSEEHKFSIVFYRSPLNGEFFNYLDAIQLRRFNYCISLVNDYFEKLVVIHPNIFYLDLTKYEPINQLGFDGFVDIHHPNREAAKMIVDVLRLSIIEGLDWEEDQP